MPILLICHSVLIFIFKDISILKYTLILSFVDLAFYWFYTNFYFSNHKDKNNNSITVLFWNVAKSPDYNMDKINDILSKNNIDIIILKEAYYENNSNNKKLERILKPYNVEYLEHFSVEYLHFHNIIAHKGKNITIKNLGGEFHALNKVVIEIKGQQLTIGAADVYANPLSFRKQALLDIYNYTQTEAIDLLVGDFNTPYQSVYFRTYENTMNNLRYQQKGYTAT